MHEQTHTHTPKPKEMFAVVQGMTFLAEWQKQIYKRTSRVRRQITQCPIAQTPLCVRACSNLAEGETEGDQSLRGHLLCINDPPRPSNPIMEQQY